MNSGQKKKNICVSGFPTLNILLWIVSKILSNLLKNGKKCIEKCNFYMKYFDKIKCYADRPYLFFSELKPETHIYIFLALLQKRGLCAMNERDLKLMCKEIKGFYSLIQWQIVEITAILWPVHFCNLQSIQWGKAFSLCNLCWSGENCLFFNFNWFCICLTHIQRILIARFSTALSIFQNSIAGFVNFCFVKLKQNLRTTGTCICYEEEGLAAMMEPGSQFNPHKPSVPFLGHRQTVQTQTRRHRMWRLIRVFTICYQE